MSAPVLMDRHAEVSHLLAERHRELGSVRAAVINARAAMWEQTAHLNITERRETCSALTADLNADVATLEEEVNALRVELRHAEMLIQYGG